MEKFWRSDWWRTLWQSVLILIATATVSCWPFAETVRYAPWPKSWYPLAQFILGLDFFPPLVWLALCCGLPVCIITLLVWKKVQSFRRLIPASVMGWLILWSSIWHLLVSSESIREAGLIRMAAQAKLLIAAIETYEAKTGRYPRALSDLTPRYIAEIPYSGMVGYPEFKYETHWKEAPFKSYELSIASPTSEINLDKFVYWPERGYPEYLYGGSTEYAGDWAYVSE